MRFTLEPHKGDKDSMLICVISDADSNDAVLSNCPEFPAQSELRIIISCRKKLDEVAKQLGARMKQHYEARGVTVTEVFPS